MKNALFIFMLILLNAYFSFSNEKEVKSKTVDIQNKSIQMNFIIQKGSNNFSESFITDTEDLETYALKKRSKAQLYAFHKKVGTGLLVPGVILFSLGFILMCAGIPLSVISEEISYRSYSYSYYYEYYGTTGNMYSRGYETIYPYQGVGIPLAATGGLFFCIGLGLLIPGAVNLAKAAKLKPAKSKKKAELTGQLAINFNYDPFNESINLNVKFKF